MPTAAGARRPRRWRRRLLVASGAVALAAGLLALRYHRQVWSYLTHWKGPPAHTEPYVAYDPAPLIHLAVAGDIGDSGTRLDATATAMARIGAAQPYDALLLLGDNVYPSGDPARLADTVFTPFAWVFAQGAELLAIVGNHDAAHTDEQMAALGMDGAWWSRRLGDVLVVGLDSNRVDDADQVAFLEHALATSDAPWKVVAVHHPPYSAGYQGSSTAVRRVFSLLFERYGVQLVLSGHDHDYQRSVPVNGVTYVVSGGAAGTRRTGEASFTAVSFSWHHFVDIAFYADHLELRAVDQDGRVADDAVIARVPAAST